MIMRSISPSASLSLRIFNLISRLSGRSARRAFVFLFVLGALVAIGSVPAAEAQNFGPNFADACIGQNLVVVKGVHPDSTATRMVLTDGGLNETSAVYCPVATYDDGSFATAFTFQLTDPNADGFTFAVTGQYDPEAPQIGGLGGGLGYQGLIGPICSSEGVACSVALKFDLYNNDGEGPNSTGLYTKGARPTVPAINLTGTGIDLHSGHPFNALVTYDVYNPQKVLVNNLTLTLTDTVTKAKWSQSFPIDITSLLNASASSDSQYLYGLGFTAATGGLGATQEILNWNTAVYYPSSNGPNVEFNSPGSNAGEDFAYGVKPGATLASSPGPSAVVYPTPLLGLTYGGINQGTSAYYAKPLDVRQFATDFDFQITNAFLPGEDSPNFYYNPPLKGGDADGFTFMISGLSNISVNQFAIKVGAVGGQGGGLGYHGIPNSVAVKFDLFNNDGEGPNSTGLYVNGAQPTVPSVDLTGSGINLHTADILHAHITYDGTTLTLTLTDATTGAKFSHGWPIDIPGAIGSSTGYAAFTGGTGGATSSIGILNWTYWGGLSESPE
jgi:Bacterial lectin/Legume lectin domain